MDHEYSPAPLRARLLPLLLITGLFFFHVFARSVFSPLLLPMQQEFSISHGASSRFFLIISIGYTVSILLSGFISHKIMHRRTIILSGVLSALGMIIVGSAPALPAVYAGLVILGAGAGLYPPSGLSVITEMVQHEHWRKSLTVHELGPHLAMVSVPLYASAVMSFLTWRAVMISAGGVMMLMVLLFFLKVRVGNNGGEHPTWVNIRTLIALPPFWIMMVLFGLALSSIQGVYLLIPSYLVSEAGFMLKEANIIFGISRFLPIASLLTAGMLLDRFGERVTIFFVLLIAGATIILLGVLSGPALALMIFLQPSVGALFFPAGISAISQIGPARTRNVAFSLLLPFASFLGSGAIPAYIGYMGEHHTFALGFITVGALTVLCSVLALMLPVGKAEKS